MIDKDLIITQQDLVDWIDRPPSNDDLDLCSYLSNAVKNQYEYHKEIDRLNKECDTYMKIATKRGNIINELEKWLNKVLEIYINVDIKTLLMVKDKLKELKEEGNKDEEK